MEEVHREGVRGGLLLEVFELEVRPMEVVLARESKKEFGDVLFGVHAARIG